MTGAVEFRRYDAGTLGQARETPQGGLRIPATVTRAGIFEYREKGRSRREYHPPEVVEASASSLAQAPITDLHPIEGMVTPDNFTKLALGQVTDAVKFDAATGHLDAEIVVQDRKLVDAVHARRRTELSSGYFVRVDATPGKTPQGEPYDVIVTAITHNHVGLGPPGWARAGREASLRLDGEGHMPAAGRRSQHMEVTLAGERFDLESEHDVKALGKGIGKLEKDLEAATARAAKSEGERDGAQGRLDAVTKERDDARARLDGIELESVTAQAKRLAPKADFGAAKDAASVRAVALAATGVRCDGHDAVYLKARFDYLVEQLDANDTNTALQLRRGDPELPVRQDGKPPAIGEAAQKAYADMGAKSRGKAPEKVAVR